MSFSPPEPVSLDGSALRIGIVAARYNADLVEALLKQVQSYLQAARVNPGAITVWRVPGSNEIPVTVAGLLRAGEYDAIVALGVVIRGETLHYEVIAHSTAQALQLTATNTCVPIINGIIVAENAAQARERCLGKIDRGAEFAWAALEMATLRRAHFPAR